MSENTETFPIHFGAFMAAMISGPVLVTVCTFWMLLIPVYALIFGGIPYLVIGIPVAFWLACTGPVTVERALQWAGLTILMITAVVILPVALIDGEDGVGFILGLGGISAVFGMAWAAASAWIYGRMTKPA